MYGGHDGFFLSFELVRGSKSVGFCGFLAYFFLLRKHQQGQCGSAAVITVLLGFDSQALDLSGWRFSSVFPQSRDARAIGSMVHKQLGRSMMKRPLAPGVTPPPPQHPMTLSAREVTIEIKASKRWGGGLFFFFFCLWEKIPGRASREIFPHPLLRKRRVCSDEEVEGR